MVLLIPEVTQLVRTVKHPQSPPAISPARAQAAKRREYGEGGEYRAFARCSGGIT